LETVLEVCGKHNQRMQYALNFLQEILPLKSKSYLELSQEQISHADQLIYRFSQLQDTIGNKLFPLILQGLVEYSPNMPFIDILNQLEKLSVIESTEHWLSLREIRNLVTHEYPGNEKEIVDALNELHQQTFYLSSTLDNLMLYIKNRKWI
jgi:hypothetical protein